MWVFVKLKKTLKFGGFEQVAQWLDIFSLLMVLFLQKPIYSLIASPCSMRTYLTSCSYHFLCNSECDYFSFWTVSIFFFTQLKVKWLIYCPGLSVGSDMKNLRPQRSVIEIFGCFCWFFFGWETSENLGWTCQAMIQKFSDLRSRGKPEALILRAAEVHSVLSFVHSSLVFCWKINGVKMVKKILGLWTCGGFRKWGYPQIIHFYGILHYKPSISGYPHLWNPPCAFSI